MSTIAQAIADRQNATDRLQAEIKALSDVEQMLGASAPAARSSPRRSSRKKAAAESEPEAKPQRKRRSMTAEEKKAVIGAHDRLLGGAEEEGREEEVAVAGGGAERSTRPAVRPELGALVPDRGPARTARPESTGRIAPAARGPQNSPAGRLTEAPISQPKAGVAMGAPAPLHGDDDPYQEREEAAEPASWRPMAPRRDHGESELMRDTHAVARSRRRLHPRPGGRPHGCAPVGRRAGRSRHVTSDQFKVGMAEMRTEIAEVRTRLTWRMLGIAWARHRGASPAWLRGSGRDSTSREIPVDGEVDSVCWPAALLLGSIAQSPRQS